METGESAVDAQTWGTHQLQEEDETSTKLDTQHGTQGSASIKANGTGWNYNFCPLASLMSQGCEHFCLGTYRHSFSQTLSNPEAQLGVLAQFKWLEYGPDSQNSPPMS